jgi:hypothetical protein
MRADVGKARNYATNYFHYNLFSRMTVQRVFRFDALAEYRYNI